MQKQLNILRTSLALFLCLGSIVFAQTAGGRRVFRRGNTRAEFKFDAEGRIAEVRSTVTKTRGGQVTGYEIITRIPRHDVVLTAAQLPRLRDEMLDMPYGDMEGMLCVSIENGVLQEDEETGTMYMDIVVTDCDGNILRTERKQVAAAPAPENFTIPEGSILDTPQQDENSPDGT